MTIRNIEIMTVGGGCFWSIEAIFNELKGVENTVSGYTGGNVPGTPTYKEVCSGLTGHAEVVQISFDANVISYEDLLSIFMMSHDPTTSNRRGNDFGSQYRSVIYYHNDTQEANAKRVTEEIASNFERRITTEISPAVKFHIAEDYHQDYYAKNQAEGYCTAIITPKLQKLRSMPAQKLKNVNDKKTLEYYGS